jgi:hypothetical protein
MTRAFERAGRKAGAPNATFHDPRYLFGSNATRAGIDSCRVIAMTGQKTVAVFKRCKPVDKHELRQGM